ncbi:MAG: DNA-processing protein DprA [Oscillospiraceae bacterium]|nr:DNA-processing protein DprA [Oscillospiraceae bacterium]
MNRVPSIVYRSWAVMVFDPGDRRLSELFQRYPDPAQLYMALGQDDEERSRLHPKIVSAIDNTTLDNARRMLAYCEQRGINVVSIDDKEYPARLKNIYAPPQILFYIGSLYGLDHHPSAGIVGTRNPSEYSRQVAGTISAGLAQRGISVISGFAEGIDITSQLSCIHSGGRTFAVMGCGVDTDYPKENKRYRQMVIDNGAIISEFFPGTSPYPKNFPQRNRILSGLSDCILVVEAGKTSGSLNTATHAADQGKTVFAVPPMDIFDDRYKGNIRLIREGAPVACGCEDILVELNVDTSAAPAPERAVKQTPRKSAADVQEHRTHERSGRSPEPSQMKTPKKEFGRTVTIPSTGSETGDRIVAQIAGSNGITLPYLMDKLGGDTDEILELLTDLELSGVIELIGNEYYLPGQKGKDRGK